MKHELSRYGLNNYDLGLLLEKISLLYDDEKYRKVFSHKDFLEALGIVGRGLSQTYLKDNKVPEISISGGDKTIYIIITYLRVSFIDTDYTYDGEYRRVSTVFQTEMYNQFNLDENG